MPSVKLDYAALTVDANIFIGNGLNLERGILKQLEQFAGGPVKLVISEVIFREIQNHLLVRVSESRAKLLSALKSTKTHFGLPTELVEHCVSQLLGPRTDQEVVNERLNDFIERTGAQIISPSNIDIQDLVRLYFEVEPPFEVGRDKKSEFPDAIALLSLQSWAQETGIRVLAVSEDKGWTNFAERSAALDSIQDLAKALAHFQPHNAAKDITESLKQLIENAGDHEILRYVAETVVDATNEAEIEVEYSSAFHADPDQTEAHYINHEFVKDKHGRPIVDLVRIEENWLVLRLRVEISYDVVAWFSMSVWDSTDKEYVLIGSSKATRTGSTDTDILVSLTSDFSKGIENVKVGGLSLDLDLPVADMGDVESNMHDD